MAEQQQVEVGLHNKILPQIHNLLCQIAAKREERTQEMVAHSFNPSIWEAEVRGSL